MKETIFKWSFFSLGALCIVVFIVARTNNIQHLIFSDKFEGYGELYNFVSITNFLEELPPKIDQRDENGEYMGYRTSPKHPTVNDADVLTFGDSFFYFPRHTTFPERLADTLGLKVFYENHPNPFSVLNKHQYKKSEPKYLIYEVGERGISSRFIYKMNTQLNDYKLGSEKPLFNSLNTQQAEIKYNRILQKSYITNRLYSLISTIKFNYFGYISSLTPLHNDSTNFLFFHDTVNGKPTSYNYNYTEEEINTIAINIMYMANQLKSMYNIDLVFMPIPSKITIYDHLVRLNNYNELLPRLYDKLDDLNIMYIDLYHPFKSSEIELYYPTDTHWNKKGIDKALDITVQGLGEKGPISQSE